MIVSRERKRERENQCLGTDSESAFASGAMVRTPPLLTLERLKCIPRLSLLEVVRYTRPKQISLTVRTTKDAAPACFEGDRLFRMKFLPLMRISLHATHHEHEAALRHSPHSFSFPIAFCSFSFLLKILSNLPSIRPQFFPLRPSPVT